MQVRTTFLGAHALPPEFAGRPDDYVDECCACCRRCTPRAWWMRSTRSANASRSRPAQTQRVFEGARALGLPVKLHAEQLSDSGGAELAARFGALSCDHLEWLGEAGAQAMARAGTVAVLLPGAFYFLRDTDCRRSNCCAGTACDGGVYRLQSGSSPCTSLLLMLNMACTLFRLTPEEALAGVTRNAARALGLQTGACSPPGSAPTSCCGRAAARAIELRDRIQPAAPAIFEGTAA
jgi:imidazolonepropionase